MYVYTYITVRTNGVSTDASAAKATNFDRLGRKVRPAWPRAPAWGSRNSRATASPRTKIVCHRVEFPGP